MAVRVDGVELRENLNALNRSLRKAVETDLIREVKEENKRVADDAAERARRVVPVRTGMLRRWTRGWANQYRAEIRAGTASKAPYAAYVEFGPHKQPFAYPTLLKNRPRYYRMLDRAVTRITSRYNRRN